MFIGEYTLNQALSFAFPCWAFDLNNWGNYGAGADPDSIVFDFGSTIGLAYAVIGPGSTASQATLDTRMPDNGYHLSVRSPGVNIIQASQVSADVTSNFGDTYYKDGVVGLQTFGTGVATFEAPSLQLFLYFQANGGFQPLRRAAMTRLINTASAGVTEQTLGIWPVMDRATKTVTIAATGTLVANVRIGAIAARGAALPAVERTVATGTVDATTGATFQANVTTPCSFLGVYATATAGAGNFNGAMLALDE